MNETSEAGIERAVTVVRSMLAALGAGTVVSVQATNPQADVFELLAIIWAFVVVAALMAWFAGRCDGGAGRRTGRLLTLQGLETVAFVGLAVVLELQVTDGAWAVLVLPLVVASLRLDDLAVLGTWFVGSTGYVLAGRFAPGSDHTDPAVILERIGLLLAIAASIALLTRWLQEGWRAQRQLTAVAEERAGRLATIERAVRALRRAETDDIVAVCTAHVPQLGFDAAYATIDGAIIGVAGTGAMVPDGAVCETPAEGEVLITRWTGSEHEVIHSASVLEPISGGVVSGWLAAEIDDAAAQALSDLVATAGSAMEAALHRSQARLEARHDPLTGLAGRAELRHKLDPAARSDEPTALVFIDLDRFEAINHNHGHLVADRLLVALADRLTDALDGDGLVARFGGDRFAILLTGAAAPSAVNLSQHIRTILAEPFRIDRYEIRVGAGIGVAVTDGSIDPDYLLEQAAGAAKEAINAGPIDLEASDDRTGGRQLQPANI